MDFSGYHIRRTTATTLLHVCLPLAYCVGLGLVAPELDMVGTEQGVVQPTVYSTILEPNTLDFITYSYHYCTHDML